MTTPIPPVLLLGAGRMGSAMFSGWCAAGLGPSVLVDPALPPDLARPDDLMLPSLDGVPADFVPGAVVLAIKPQTAPEILPVLGARLRGNVPVLSILAGLTVGRLSDLLGGEPAVVRAMPNTPAAIGQGMTVAFAGQGVTPAQHALCDRLLAASGELAWIDDEALIDPITSVSGCGPAGRPERSAARPGTPARPRDGVRRGRAAGRFAAGLGRVAPCRHQPERRHRTRAGRADAAGGVAGGDPGRPARGHRTVARTRRVECHVAFVPGVQDRSRAPISFTRRWMKARA